MMLVFSTPPKQLQLATLLLQASMLEKNSETVSMLLEINNLVDHAGLSPHLKLFQIDSVLLVEKKLPMFSHLKTWSLATPLIQDVMEVTLTMHGTTSTRLVLSLTPVCLINQELELLANAQLLVLIALKNGLSTNVKQLPSHTLTTLPFKMNWRLMDLWEPDSMFTLTS